MTSDNAPAGNFRATPVSVDAATINPTAAGEAPSSRAKSGKTGDRHIA
jgi:hypothetical protein